MVDFHVSPLFSRPFLQNSCLCFPTSILPFVQYLPSTYHFIEAIIAMWPFPSSETPANGNTAGSSSPSQPIQSTAVPQDSPTSYFSSQDSRFDQSGPSYEPVQAPTSQDLFSNPSVDFSRLHPLAGLGREEIEYLDVVDAQPSTLEGARTALPSRGWSDDLCYGTGTTYLSGKHCNITSDARKCITDTRHVPFSRSCPGRLAWCSRRICTTIRSGLTHLSTSIERCIKPSHQTRELLWK